MFKENHLDKKSSLSVRIYGSTLYISLITLCLMAGLEIFMLIFSVANASYYGEYLWRYRAFYISLLVMVLLYIGLCLYVKADLEKRFRILDFSNPFFAAYMLGWSLGITYSDWLTTGSVELTVFMTFSLSVPLCFYMMPGMFAFVVLLADAGMLYFVASTGTLGEVINLVIYYAFQLVLGVSLLGLRSKLVERIAEEQKNADMDILTGVYNRRAFDQDMKTITKNGIPEDLVCFTVDLNGLKDVNDNHGHDAGDMMITGTTDCLKKAFGDNCRIYRTGGDEFVVLMFAKQDELAGMIERYEKGLKEWTDNNVLELSTAYGYCCAADHPSEGINKLAAMADEQMYKDKALYYKTTGKIRR